jgi:hypothetical protein
MDIAIKIITSIQHVTLQIVLNALMLKFVKIVRYLTFYGYLLVQQDLYHFVQAPVLMVHGLQEEHVICVIQHVLFVNKVQINVLNAFLVCFYMKKDV